jgi:high-affinity K+ transport system ATPase subunit B
VLGESLAGWIIIGSISLCARRAIIVKSPVVLEQIAGCRTAIFDKTGRLTYGEPKLTEQLIAPGFAQPEVLLRPFVPACCCITPYFLADSRLPVHFAPAESP